MYDEAIPQLEALRHLKQLCLAAEMRSAARAITKFYTDRLPGSPIGVAQLALLMRVYLLGEASMLNLAQEMETDRTTLARNVDVLRREGYLQVMPGADRRSRLVSLTAEGMNVLRETVPKWQAAQADFLAEIGDATWHNLMRDLRQVAIVEQEF